MDRASLRVVGAAGLPLLIIWCSVQAPLAAGPSETIVEGTVIPGGVECPLLRLTDGRVVTLDGVAEAKRSGERGVRVGTVLRLRGRVVPFSSCQQGVVFSVFERLQ